MFAHVSLRKARQQDLVVCAVQVKYMHQSKCLMHEWKPGLILINFIQLFLTHFQDLIFNLIIVIIFKKLFILEG